MHSKKRSGTATRKDPTADIEGDDACRKICILADLAFGDKIDPAAVSCEGITNITLEDVAAADRMGYAIKLLGRAKRTENGKVYAFVAPHLLAKTSPLASVEGVFNGISVTGNMVGEVMFYGRGAGKHANCIGCGCRYDGCTGAPCELAGRCDGEMALSICCYLWMTLRVHGMCAAGAGRALCTGNRGCCNHGSDDSSGAQTTAAGRTGRHAHSVRKGEQTQWVFR